MAKILYFNKNVIHQSRVNGAPYVEPEHVNQKWRLAEEYLAAQANR